MQLIKKLTLVLAKKAVRLAIALVILVGVLVLVVGSRHPADSEVSADRLPVVTLTTPLQYSGQQSLSLVGTVRAFSEAKVTTERAGRVTSVPVSLGQSVSAGTVVATLENASERAAVLQAQGVYESALAAAEQSGVGVDEANNALRNAQNNAISTFQSAYNTNNNIVRNSIDDFFADPDARIPGLRIDGRGFTADLNTERVVYQTLLLEWQNKTNLISPDSDLKTELDYAKQQTQRTIAFLDTFLSVFAKQSRSSSYTTDEIQGFIDSFTNQRASLIAVKSSIDSAFSGLTSAEDGLRRAELAATGGTVSAADAQVKQALGTLRAAEANLAKTVLRTPVSGTVNSLSVRTGDFINAYSPVAIVANNNTLEITTYISDAERSLLSVDDQVSIEGAYPGLVTHVSPAVDPDTRKIEVRIATEGEGINNGDTVRITKEVSAEASTNEPVRIPLSAVKFESENGSIFTVIDGKLVAKPVTLGVVRSGSVEITEGLTHDELFVIDARGLLAGEEVMVSK